MLQLLAFLLELHKVLPALLLQLLRLMLTLFSLIPGLMRIAQFPSEALHLPGLLRLWTSDTHEWPTQSHLDFPRFYLVKLHLHGADHLLLSYDLLFLLFDSSLCS